MNEKNLKLAKENTELKIVLKEKIDEHEKLLKNTIKTKYINNISYKEMLDGIEESIESIKKCLIHSIAIKESLLKSQNVLKEKNTQSGTEDIKKTRMKPKSKSIKNEENSSKIK